MGIYWEGNHYYKMINEIKCRINSFIVLINNASNIGKWSSVKY